MANIPEHVPVSINWKEVSEMEADAVKTYQQMLVCEQILAEIGSIPLSSFEESDLVDPGSLHKVVHSLHWHVNAIKYRTLLGQKTLYDEVLKLVVVAEEAKTEVGAVEERVDEIKTSVELIEKHLEVLEKHMSTMEDHMTNVDKLQKSMDGKTETLDETVGAMDKKLDALEEKLDAIEEKLDAMDGKLDYVIKELPNLIREAVEAALKNVGLVARTRRCQSG